MTGRDHPHKPNGRVCTGDYRGTLTWRAELMWQAGDDITTAQRLAAARRKSGGIQEGIALVSHHGHGCQVRDLVLRLKGTPPMP